MRNNLFLVLSIAFLCGCGGKTEADDDPAIPDAGAADASPDSPADASPDSPAEVGPDAAAEASADSAGDTSPQPDCFQEDGKLAAWGLKECQGGGSCLVKAHQINCCGTSIWMGIGVGAESAFDACEAAWREQLGLCNCPAEAPKTEQPQVVVLDMAEVNVGCMNCTMDSCVCMTSPK